MVSCTYNQIQCNVDSSTSGKADVTITLGNQVASLGQGFTFSNETAVITNISPGYEHSFNT